MKKRKNTPKGDSAPPSNSKLPLFSCSYENGTKTMGNEDSPTCLYKFVDVANGISEKTIPNEVITKSRQCLVDFMGVFLGGSQKEASKKLRKALGRAAIQGSPENLAFWLGSTARMLDLDDGHRFAMGHPGVAINAAAVAMATALPNVSGRKMLEAIIKGYEVYCYQGRVINPSAYLKRGMDATSVCGAGAAAMVAGTMMGLSTGQISNAISLAASLTGGLNQSAIDGSAQKYLVAGWAAKLGIAAANLARCGFDGPRRIFEGKLGFCNAFSPEPDLRYLHNPTLVWDVLNVYFKIHACVRRIHATLDAVKVILDRQRLAAEQINHVQVWGGTFLYDAGVHRPQDVTQAQTSVPYAVAVLLTYGKVSDELVHKNIADEKIAALSDRVTVSKDDEMIRLAEKDGSLWGAARVEIATTDSSVFEETKIYPDGDPESPFSETVLHGKFVELVTEAISKEESEKMWNEILSVDRSSGVGEKFSWIVSSI